MIESLVWLFFGMIILIGFLVIAIGVGFFINTGEHDEDDS